MSTPAVLIVDDEKNILLTLGMALENLSISVDTADTGAAALDKLTGGSYDLLLLDLRLPDLDGMEILRRIAQMRPEIKVIIITAYGSIDLAVEAMKLGAVDFLQKPFDTAEVRAMVSRILDRETQEKQRGRIMSIISIWPASGSGKGILIRPASMPKRRFSSIPSARKPSISWEGSMKLASTARRPISITGSPWNLTPPLSRPAATWNA